jgi:hypothetical protein
MVGLRDLREVSVVVDEGAIVLAKGVVKQEEQGRAAQIESVSDYASETCLTCNFVWRYSC